MQLEDFFDFLAEDDIRLKGTRIGIETILYDYIYRARTAEEIADTYPNASLAAVLRHNSLLPEQPRRHYSGSGNLARVGASTASANSAKNPTSALVRVRQMISERQQA